MRNKVTVTILSMILVFTMMPAFAFADADTGDTEISDGVAVEESIISSEDSDEYAVYSDLIQTEEEEPGEFAELSTSEPFEGEVEDLESAPDDSEFEPAESSEEFLYEESDLEVEEPEYGEEFDEELLSQFTMAEDTGEDTGDEGDPAAGEEPGTGEEPVVDDGDLEIGGNSLKMKSRVTVGAGNSITIPVGFEGKAKRIGHLALNKTVCDVEWIGNLNNLKLKINAKQSGSAYVTVVMFGGPLGIIPLDIVNLKVEVPKLNVSTNAFSVQRGSAGKLTFSYSSCSESVTMDLAVFNPSVFSYKWGKWDKNRNIPLTITGKQSTVNKDKAYIIAYLVNSKNKNEVYASQLISVSVKKKPGVQTEYSGVSIFRDSQAKVKVTAVDLGTGLYYFRLLSDNTKSYKVHWEGSYLVIEGIEKGHGTIAVALYDNKTNKEIARSNINVAVNDNPQLEITRKNLTLTEGEYANITCVGKGVTGGVRFRINPSHGDAFVKAEFIPVIVPTPVTGPDSQPVRITALHAGQEKLTVTLLDSKGKALREDYITVTVKKAPPPPQIVFEENSVNLYPEASTQLIGYLNYMPAGTKSISSRRTAADVANVNAELVNNQAVITITAKKAGKCTVYIEIDGTINGNTQNLATSSFDINVTSVNRINALSYSFNNNTVSKATGAPSLTICKYMFPGEQARLIHDALDKSFKKNSYGSCFGISATSSLMFSPNDIYASDFTSSSGVRKSLIRQINWKDINKSNNIRITAGQWIQAMQIAQLATISETNYEADLNAKVSKIKSGIQNHKYPVVDFHSKDKVGDSYFAHAVLAYDFVTINEEADKILIYDSNSYYNGNAQSAAIFLYKNSNGQYTSWEYSDEYEIGGERFKLNSQTCKLGYCSYDTLMKLWNSHGDARNAGRLNRDSSIVIAAVSSDCFKIKDVEDNLLAEVADGELVTDNPEIKIADYAAYCSGAEGGSPMSFVYLPVDVYTFANESTGADDFYVGIANEELSASVTTTGNEITVCADDSSDFASAVLDANQGDQYTITLGSSREGEPDEVELTGMGSGDTISVMSLGGSLDLCNAEDAEMTVSADNSGDAEVKSYTILSESESGGRIEPEGSMVVFEGGTAEYHMIPDEGYTVSDVLVDGKSVGAVSSYEFKDLHSSHMIEASFAKKPAPAAQPAAPAEVLDSKLPALKLSSVKKAKKSFTAKWKKLSKKKQKTIKGLEVQYSLTGNFSSSDTRIKKVKKTGKSLKVKKLKSGKKYYIRIRSYTTVNGVKHVSKWSKAKKVKVK